MAFEGEFHQTLEPIKCEDCGASLPLGIQMSAAGYYIGRWCENCGPYERCSDYFPSREAAESELTLWHQGVRLSERGTDFQGGPPVIKRQ